MKIEDLTLKEIKQQCDSGCNGCPLWGYWRGRDFDDCLLNVSLPTFWTTEDMEREVTNEDRGLNP